MIFPYGRSSRVKQNGRDLLTPVLLLLVKDSDFFISKGYSSGSES